MKGGLCRNSFTKWFLAPILFQVMEMQRSTEHKPRLLEADILMRGPHVIKCYLQNAVTANKV